MRKNADVGADDRGNSMLEGRHGFYRDVVAATLPRKASVLVIAGGVNDKAVFGSLGFEDAVFTNIDDMLGGEQEFAPFKFSVQDAEALTFADQSFDYAVVHAALHHCASPHRALLEMYRVARRGVLVFEARDSALMRLLQRMKLTQTFEIATVHAHGGTAGGLRNGPVPNFIYRWTEREVTKAIDCYAPERQHRFAFHYGHDAPAFLLLPGRNLKKALLRFLYAAYRPLAKIFPRQQNLFAFYVEKADRRPWIVGDPAMLDMEWAAREAQ